MPRTRREVAPLLLLLPLLGGMIPGAPLSAAPPAPEAVEQGRFLYEIYCESCHGTAADGRSPMAESLGTPPSDLTRLSASGGEDFPSERVYRAIDGREEISDHRRREMPIWGLNFQELEQDTDQEEEVRAKILRLIDYLKSIQQTPKDD